MKKKKIVSFETKDGVILMPAKKYAKSEKDYISIEEAIQAAYQLGKQDEIDEIINHRFILGGFSAHC